MSSIGMNPADCSWSSVWKGWSTPTHSWPRQWIPPTVVSWHPEPPSGCKNSPDIVTSSSTSRLAQKPRDWGCSRPGSSRGNEKLTSDLTEDDCVTLVVCGYGVKSKMYRIQADDGYNSSADDPVWELEVGVPFVHSALEPGQRLSAIQETRSNPCMDLFCDFTHFKLWLSNCRSENTRLDLDPGLCVCYHLQAEITLM